MMQGQKKFLWIPTSGTEIDFFLSPKVLESGKRDVSGLTRALKMLTSRKDFSSACFYDTHVKLLFFHLCMCSWSGAARKKYVYVKREESLVPTCPCCY